MARRHVVISPHFDDAVLSVALLLQRLGSRATVATVCGGVPAADVRAGKWDCSAKFSTAEAAARTRALEDRTACALTGATPMPLRFLDRPYRAPVARPAADLHDEVERLLGHAGDAVLWIPWGDPGNDDHVEVHDALLSFARAHPQRTGVYADLPYTGSRGDAFLSEKINRELVGFALYAETLEAEAFACKRRMVECHASQVPLLEAVEDWDTLLRDDGPLRRERYWLPESLEDHALAGILQV